MPTDYELTAQIQATGDEAAFRELYRRHTPRLFQVLLRTLDTQADAEDATQETWIRAVQSLKTFQWESAFQTWLVGIGINVARNMMRKRHEHLQLIPDVPAPVLPSPEDRIDLERALARLAPGQRMVLVLHDIEGWTHEQIAERLDVTPGTSRGQLSDARRSLRALLSPVPFAGYHHDG